MKLLVKLFVLLLIMSSLTTIYAAGPRPYSPADGARLWIGDPVVVFAWASTFGSYGYYLEFDDDNDWSESLGGFEIADTYFDLGDYLSQDEWDGLMFNLYWRVRAILFDGSYGEPGTAFHFSKTVWDPPETWQPLPEQLLKPWSQPVTFTWETYPEGVSYDMQFASNIEFTQTLGEFTWNQPNFNLTPYISPTDWHYAYFGLFWRVAGTDRYGNQSPFGPGAGFSKLGYRRVLCYGDSITGGFGSSTFDPDVDEGFAGYPPILQEKLLKIDPLCSVTSKWFSGGKAEDGDNSLYDVLHTKCPGVIVMMFGTVDNIDPSNCEDGDCRVVEHLINIVDVCRELAIVPVICTVIPYNPDGGHPKFPDVSVIQYPLDELNIAIREICDTKNIAIVDLDQAMRDNAPDEGLAELYSDWAHPNDEGYAIIAKAVFDTVKNKW